jgi:hypothetical protein
LATSGDLDLAISGDFYMATDKSREAAARLRQPVILWVSEASPSVMAIMCPRAR